MQYTVLRYILHSAPIYGYLGFWGSRHAFQVDVPTVRHRRACQITTGRDRACQMSKGQLKHQTTKSKMEIQLLLDYGYIALVPFFLIALDAAHEFAARSAS
jgi:hypothetical protein